MNIGGYNNRINPPNRVATLCVTILAWLPAYPRYTPDTRNDDGFVLSPTDIYGREQFTSLETPYASATSHATK